ncbi:hypothetical protein WDW89_21420 [Deltaproteobacteria bacterium TL4]
MKTYILAIMSYLGILCLIPVLLNEKDEYVYFHARQGLALWIWNVIAFFALYIPGIGQFFFGVSTFLIIIFSLIGLISVILTKAWKLPLVGNIAGV